MGCNMKAFLASWAILISAGMLLLGQAPKDTEPMEFACAEGSQTLPNVFGIEFVPTR